MAYNNYYDLLYGSGTGSNFPSDIVLQRSNARNLHYINTGKFNPTGILSDQQMLWFGSNMSPINGTPLMSLYQAISEISTIRAISDMNAKRAMNDALKGTSINAEGNIKHWIGVGAVVAGAIATIFIFKLQADPPLVSKTDALKLKMQGLGYPSVLNVDNGWIYPDGYGCNMMYFSGPMAGHGYMLQEMGIYDDTVNGYTAMEVAFYVWKLIRKPDNKIYEFGDFNDSATINALMVQIRNDVNRGKLKGADRVLIECKMTGQVINPTVDELYYENFGSLIRTFRSTSVYQ